ncbi:MAG: hypothetical protein R3E44_13880 [Paracoccaceae bacterium]
MPVSDTTHQTIALFGVIGLAAGALALVSYVIIRHNVIIAENNIRMLTICLVLPMIVMIAFIPDSVLSDRSAVYGLIGTISGYILGRVRSDGEEKLTGD